MEEQDHGCGTKSKSEVAHVQGKMLTFGGGCNLSFFHMIDQHNLNLSPFCMGLIIL